MKRKLSLMLFIIAALLLSVTVVHAGRPDHSLGAIFSPTGSGYIGHGVEVESGICGGNWGASVYSENDFVRISPDETYFTKINEQKGELFYYENWGSIDPLVVWSGTGHVNANWNGTLAGGYGVWINARGTVSNGVETKKMFCLYAFDEDTGIEKIRFTLR